MSGGEASSLETLHCPCSAPLPTRVLPSQGELRGQGKEFMYVHVPTCKVSLLGKLSACGGRHSLRILGEEPLGALGLPRATWAPTGAAGTLETEPKAFIQTDTRHLGSLRI